MFAAKSTAKSDSKRSSKYTESWSVPEANRKNELSDRDNTIHAKEGPEQNEKKVQG
jgi:hypothetical protein